MAHKPGLMAHGVHLNLPAPVSASYFRVVKLLQAAAAHPVAAPVALFGHRIKLAPGYFIDITYKVRDGLGVSVFPSGFLNNGNTGYHKPLFQERKHFLAR